MIRFGVQAAGMVAVTAALLSAPPADAARHRTKHAPAAARVATETLGSAGVWSAYLAHDKTGRVCYLAGQPQKSEAAGVTRHQPMAMVTHRPAEHIANVVSFVEAYTLKPGSVVTVTVGDRTFDLFTEGDSAWAKTSDLDRTIVAALAKGTTAIARGEAENGRRTTDVYSLDGFSKALALIDKACHVTRDGEIAPPHHAKPRRPAHRKAPSHQTHEKHKPAKPQPAKSSN
jgi:Invasion associated locus B (IalB) protein